ncbi:hypothetical protein DD592_27550 [Enterobacter cloacae complex sp. 2DZ2F20B]|nr:hypothetical protein DD592_27550 [Enterobacter cloacae complex sp. 2DZ2F20B]
MFFLRKREVWKRQNHKTIIFVDTLHSAAQKNTTDKCYKFSFCRIGNVIRFHYNVNGIFIKEVFIIRDFGVLFAPKLSFAHIQHNVYSLNLKHSTRIGNRKIPSMFLF